MNAVERQLAEIAKYKRIVEKTNNPYVKRDYSKAIRRLKRELREYYYLKYH